MYNFLFVYFYKFKDKKFTSNEILRKMKFPSLRSFDTAYNIDDSIIYKLHDSDMHPHYHLMHSLCFKPS